MAGTQVADRCLGLKPFIPKGFPRKLGKSKDATMHPELSKLVSIVYGSQV